jgi:SRSO17 transposase
MSAVLGSMNEQMIRRANAASVPFQWEAADSVYGVGEVEQVLRRAGDAGISSTAAATECASANAWRAASATAAPYAASPCAADVRRAERARRYGDRPQHAPPAASRILQPG